MKDKNREFEETGAFLDLMTKKERKLWEKEQARLKVEETKKIEEENKKEENESEEQQDKIETKPIEKQSLEQTTQEIDEKDNDLEPIADTITQEELEKELEKTKQLTELTQELSINIEIRKDESEESSTKEFNPITLLGVGMIIILTFFIYIVINTKYDNSTFLTVNSAIILFLTFCFGLTVLCNRKHVKLFAIFDLLVILAFIIFNGISITNYENIYNKVDINPKDNKIDNIEEEKPIVNEKDEVVINEYHCSNDEQTTNVDIKEINGYITYIKRTEILKNNDLALETISFYKDKDGIITNIDDATIMIEFDFNTLDINQYKLVVKEHNDSYRLDSDFSYIEDDKINYEKYINSELRTLTCSQKEN